MNGHSRGFISAIITVIIALALLKYFFDWNVLDFLKSEGVRDVFSYIKRFLDLIWNDFVARPLGFVWNEIIVNIIWKAILGSFELLKSWVDSKN